jgi:hypothetical protein
VIVEILGNLKDWIFSLEFSHSGGSSFKGVGNHLSLFLPCDDKKACGK